MANCEERKKQNSEVQYYIINKYGHLCRLTVCPEDQYIGTSAVNTSKRMTIGVMIKLTDVNLSNAWEYLKLRTLCITSIKIKQIFYYSVLYSPLLNMFSLVCMCVCVFFKFSLNFTCFLCTYRN